MTEGQIVYHIAVLDEKLPALHPMIVRDSQDQKVKIISVTNKQLLWKPWRHLHIVHKMGLGHYVKRLAYRDESGTIKDVQTSCEDEFEFEFVFIDSEHEMQDLVDRDNVAWSDSPIVIEYDRILNPILMPVPKQ